MSVLQGCGGISHNLPWESLSWKYLVVNKVIKGARWLVLYTSNVHMDHQGKHWSCTFLKFG